LKTRAAISTGVVSRSLAAALALATACSSDPASPGGPVTPAAGPVAAAAAAGPEFVPGEVIVRFRPGASASARGAAMRAANAQAGERIHTGAMRRRGDDEGLTVLHTALAVPAAVEALRGLPAVEYAEPNWIYRHGAVSNDPGYAGGSLWGMYGDASTPANQFGSQAAEAWGRDRTSCGGVYVGIIDEGYMYTHEDLAANAGVNPRERAGDNVDNDGNGYVDDVYGWDFDGNNNTVFDGVGDDHGTHVAGTIGGVGGNGKGVAGVCWSVKLLSAKFLGRNGGTTANAIKAVDYFTDLKTRHGIRLGRHQQLVGRRRLLAGAAGRDRARQRRRHPLRRRGRQQHVQLRDHRLLPGEYPNANVISVASITNTGAISSFSNYGSTTIDLGAPGSGVYSTVPVSARGNKVGSGYATYSGTSMATPHVSGAAALYAATRPGATAADIKAAILGSAVPTASLSGKTVTGGRLDASGF
jgi:subtilisin family serine protease